MGNTALLRQFIRESLASDEELLPHQRGKGIYSINELPDLKTTLKRIDDVLYLRLPLVDVERLIEMLRGPFFAHMGVVAGLVKRVRAARRIHKTTIDHPEFESTQRYKQHFKNMRDAIHKDVKSLYVTL